MRIQGHIARITKCPNVATSNFTIKLESTTEIIDRLLLANRQAPWKATGPADDSGTDTGTGTTTDI
ncbi:MAG: hypothetical protein HYV27_04360 [Candidatus Hydrogenedentes bacterium]|nr:hypothetical protein [Candidatus Hydrogenedentota bacterium]